MNNQQIDKIVNFYRINHQFHDPYQLLLDGNFIKLLLEKEIDLKRKFQNTTKGKVTIRVTNCVLRQLQLLGDSFKLVYQHAKKEKTINCKHDETFGVDRCFLDLIGEANQKMYLVCSQDLQLRRTLRYNGRVPIVYFGPDQRITMQDIPKYSLFQINKQQRLKFLPNQAEAKEVEQLRRKTKQQQLKKHIKTISSQQGINLKLKVAKGPNPMSMKRKKRPTNNNPDNQQNEQEPAKRKRIRKNKKGISNNQAATN